MNAILRVLRSCDSASTTRFALPVPQDGRRTLATGWLLLALASLVASGLFSVLLVLSRAPYVKDIFPMVDFFRVALVVHVDLSVLVWFLAFGGVLWSINSTPRALALGWAALALAAAGTVLMAIAPFIERGTPIMSNYVPVIDGPAFLAGLVVFGAGCVAAVARGMVSAPAVGARMDGAGALRFGLHGSLAATAIAALAFLWSWRALPPDLDVRAWYELLFWGGGHALQFTYTLLMFVAWLWLADAAGCRVALSPRMAALLFGVALVAVFLTPVIYLAWGVESVEHHRMLTWLMRFGGGLAILPFVLAVSVGLARAGAPAPAERPLRAALLMSLILFGSGGLIGLAISGSNVKIPAHYHGCIVGVTIALMGLTFHLLPRFGLGRVDSRAAFWQPVLYGVGQLLHIGGLVWSGGYGVQRKVAGADQALRSLSELLGMGIMGIGGLVAVGGGVLFLVIVWRAIAHGRRHHGGRHVPA